MASLLIVISILAVLLRFQATIGHQAKHVSDKYLYCLRCDCDFLSSNLVFCLAFHCLGHLILHLALPVFEASDSSHPSIETRGQLLHAPLRPCFGVLAQICVRKAVRCLLVFSASETSLFTSFCFSDAGAFLPLCGHGGGGVTTRPPAVQERFCLLEQEPLSPGVPLSECCCPGLARRGPSWCLIRSPLLTLGFPGLLFSPHSKG